MKGYKPFALTLILLLFLSFPAAGAERIVSLAPAVTEALFALGEGASVVGVTDFDVSPEEVLALPRVGGYLDPSLERILSLRPTLVVGTETFHGPLLERLATLVPRTLSLSLHRRLDDVEKALLALGGYLGKEAEARAVWNRIDGDLEALRQRIALRFGERPPSLLVVVWTDPLTIAGGVNYLDDLMDRLGIPNAAGDVVYTFPQVDREKVLAMDPDLVIVAKASRGMVIEDDDFIALFDDLPLRAVRKGAVTELPADVLFHPGPGVVEAARLLAETVERWGEP
jgi:iron complex transport system substrate-binding protein